MVTNTDIADYYNQTLNHYQTWWKLDKAMAVHYGLKDNNTKGFADELLNTNRRMAEMAVLQPKMHVLDAGCGVGGSLFYLAEHFSVTADSRPSIQKANLFHQIALIAQSNRTLWILKTHLLHHAQ
jgi:cyclopropane fatty-acyl-phospholipid synthase-like methyltransferase